MNPVIVSEKQFRESLIAFIKSLSPEQKAKMRQALYEHFGLPPEEEGGVRPKD